MVTPPGDVSAIDHRAMIAYCQAMRGLGSVNEVSRTMPSEGCIYTPRDLKRRRPRVPKGVIR
jgi:hypothetical protein